LTERIESPGDAKASAAEAGNDIYMTKPGQTGMGLG
jgi:hypothetical protein